VKMHLQRGGHLSRVLGTRDVNSLDVESVLAFINQRLDEGAARETVRKELSTLRRALKLAHGRRLLVGGPTACIPEFRARYQPRLRYLTVDELQRLLNVLKCHRQLWVALAVFTGGRESEIDHLRWEDIDWRKRLVLLRGTKTAGSFRSVPLVRALADA